MSAPISSPNSMRVPRSQVYSPVGGCGIRDARPTTFRRRERSLRRHRARRAPPLRHFPAHCAASRARIVRVTPTSLRDFANGRVGVQPCSGPVRRPGRLERKTDEPPGRIRGIRAERGGAHAHARRLRRDHRPRRPRARLLAPAHARQRHPARQADLGVRARPPRRPHDRRGAASAPRAPSRSSSTCSPPPASRPTTRSTCRSSRPRPPRRRSAFDLVVSASAVYGGSWLEGAGAVYAENEVLAWLAGEFGLPADRGRRVRAGRHARQPLGARRGPRARALRAAHEPARMPPAAGRSCAAPRRTPRSPRRRA